MSTRLSVNAHPSPTLVQLVLWGVIGTFVLVGGTVGYTVAEIATRKWPSPLRGDVEAQR